MELAKKKNITNIKRELEKNVSLISGQHENVKKQVEEKIKEKFEQKVK